MRLIARIFGTWFLGLALILLIIDGTKSLAANAIVMTPLGQTWFELHVASLNLAQAIIQRYLHPLLWDPVIVTILGWPGWAVMAVPGVVFAVLGRTHSRRRFEQHDSI